ncbi:16S rRNA (guanine(527)-N(7))-methyltransferase RsmG [Dokdonella koreensis]|uniref:Ribosomal RNA small subunit methyltransferase G n=1 Tax=Dokdonella koreensis DS-123 TaxID=1300342 RepID=A0A160DXX3_9GAMM|nr:16S rRNA (guanine(527)-N(7))-methyltransferase RsmG [Dokdonella koreensis]ANB19414.1 rRNA small subunit 7-methylguanosine (m7G) methyltransferase GidB [Dokdonella koreensis DS-123]
MPAREPLRPLLTDGATRFGLDLADATAERLLDYIDLLVRWNRAYNLSAVRDPAAMVVRHLLDSLAIARWVDGAALADVGSGAGLPGIPLAILAPERPVLLIDANGKKARFLRAAARDLGLRNVRVAESRVEAVDGTFDCVTARAFATLAEMLDSGGHLLAPGGRWLAMKGRFPQDEIDAVPAGFRIDAVHALEVPGLGAERHLVVIQRNAQDPAPP